MFKKNERLGRADFSQYFKVGRRFQSPSLTLVYTPRVSLKTAVVVGKKVSKRAVVRNRTRRRLYSTLRRFSDTEHLTAGVFIIITKPVAGTLSRVALATECTSLLAQVPKAR